MCFWFQILLDLLTTPASVLGHELPAADVIFAADLLVHGDGRGPERRLVVEHRRDRGDELVDDLLQLVDDRLVGEVAVEQRLAARRDGDRSDWDIEAEAAVEDGVAPLVSA